MEKHKLERINQLARKAKETLLTEEELREREALRREYIALYRADLRAQLENTYLVGPDGEKRKLGKKSDHT